MKRILEIIISLTLIYIFIEYIMFLESSLYFALGLFLFMPFSSFIIAPIMRIKLLFKFYSKVLVVQFPNKKVYDLHLASHFDLINFSKSATNGKRMIFFEIVEGLLRICEEIEEEKLPKTLKIRAVTYFMNNRTLEKFGFVNVKITPHYAFIYMFDYVGILITNYFITKKFGFVNIVKTKKATMTGENLLKNKENLLKLKLKLIEKL